MRIFHSLSGEVTIQIISADCTRILDVINQNGIRMFCVQQVDELTVQMQLKQRDYQKVRLITQKLDAEASLVRRQGVYWIGKRLLKRAWLVIGFFCLIAVTLYLPTRILFVEVQGNLTIPSKQIIAQANACGISFGASRRAVRSEKVKNSLMGAIPQLQWVGVNTYGCTAVISVTEKVAAQTQVDDHGVSSIVATRDGVVVSSTVTKGNALCKAGQAVKAGEVLVSGYTDCGISIQATRAQAEIYAQTLHDLTAVTPLSYTVRGERTNTRKYYSIRIGKQQIGNCARSDDQSRNVMTRDEYTLTLPGGFQIPVTLIVETVHYYEMEETTLKVENVQEYMRLYLRNYLLQSMIAGEILKETTHLSDMRHTGQMTAAYVCLEMIGAERMENGLESVESVP